jgi:hypothetical protein
MATVSTAMCATACSRLDQLVLRRVCAHLKHPRDLVAFRAVCNAWRHAADALWVISASYGRAATLLGNAAGGHDVLQHMACLAADSFEGWCEDPFTVHGGQPYTMQLTDVTARDAGHVCGPSATHQRIAEGLSTWTYTEPLPRTRVRLLMHAPHKEVRWLRVALRIVSGAPCILMPPNETENARLVQRIL